MARRGGECCLIHSASKEARRVAILDVALVPFALRDSVLWLDSLHLGLRFRMRDI
jgi:hypothetical protein